MKVLRMKTSEILNKFFPDFVDREDYPVNPNREEQYRKIFDDKEMDKFFNVYPHGGSIKNDLSDDYMKKLLMNLIDCNEIFYSLKSNVSVAMIKSENSSTCCFSYKDNHVVLFDINAMILLWMLNKSFLYGSEMGRENQILLYVKILLFFLSKSFKLNPFPKPATPPHPDRSSLANLATITEIQESFMLAHEMAHIVLDKNKAIASHIKFVGEFFDMVGFDINQEDRTHICEELEADKIAIDSLINTFEKRGGIFISDNKRKDIYTITTSAVFLLIRYNLWINITGNELFQLRDTFNIWFVRNAFFRSLLSDNYSGGTHIIEILDILEDTFEPASLIASDAIKKYVEEINNNTK